MTDLLGKFKPNLSQPMRQTKKYSNAILLGVIADGMGGMAQEEIVSLIAVKTILDASLNNDLTTAEQRANG